MGMNDESRPHRNRYDVTGNLEAEYVDAEGLVLVNKPGITDLEQLQLLEEECLTKAYETLLDEIRLDTPLTVELICYVHERIFGALFAWAGRWRTVTISKPGVTWPPPAYLAENMELLERNVLSKYPAAALGDDATFCRAVAEIQGEFLVIHPFREGNARAIKLVTDLLAAQTDRPPLSYDQSDAGRDAYIVAASQAFGSNFAPLEAIIRRALETARGGPATRP
jgi:cell filamentation protein